LTDQQIAGAIMWGAGDVILVGAITAVAAAWIRTEERKGRRMPGAGSSQTEGVSG
jgi:cytochrome c oxidase assembly factor CtaG